MRLPLIFVLLGFTFPALAQEADTVYLQEVSVTAFSESTPAKSLPASVSKLGPESLEYAGEAKPLYAINQLPGVRLEERSPGSYRLSVRGSALRSPFGVRNVKIYWNGTPLTEANGTTPLNLLDASLYQQMEVVRSPAGSYYGAGTGGALLINSLPAESNIKGPEAELAFGSDNYRRYHLAYTASQEENRWRAGASFTATEGYRTHSEFERLNVYWLSENELNPRRSLLSKILLSRLIYDIPGGLTEEQFAQDPRMARPGSAEKNASINQHYALLSLGQHWQLNERLQNISHVFTNLGFLDHPFNTDYKRDLSSGLGARSIWRYQQELGTTSLTWQAGGEYQLGLELARNFGNVNGQPDTLNFDDEIRTHTAFLFLQASADLAERWQLSGGLSLNWLRFDIDRLQDARQPAPYSLEKKLNPFLAPRLALLYRLQEAWELWAQFSGGYSPPTLEEIRTNEGSLNRDLEAERGYNYELGLRKTQGRIQAELIAYYLRLRQTISSYTEANSPVVKFRNAGAADQWGSEFQTNLQLLSQDNWLLEAVLSAAYQHYRYTDYRQQDEDFSGNALPGVAPFTSSLSLRASFNDRISLQALQLFSEEIPLNAANTAYSDAYQTLNLRLNARPFAKYRALQVFVSGQNLLNERYSLGYDINAFGQRYYQPAPGRQWFAGLRLLVD